MKLIEYIQSHTQRGACKCGNCSDAPPNPEAHQPKGHTADLVFFEVSAVNNPTAEELLRLIVEHLGEFCAVDLLDGAEHGYVEIGGWIGDQGAALTLMGLGSLLGLWELLTPKSMLGKDAPPDLVNQMAGAGMISIMANKIPIPA